MLVSRLLKGTAQHYRRARLAMLGQSVAWRRVGGGFEMLIDPTESHDQSFYLNTFEPALVHLLTRCISSGDTCVDIGSQKGYVTLRMAQLVGASGGVYSFEPDPRARSILQSNIDHNGYAHVKVFSYAIADTAGECTFTLSSVLGWSSRFPNEGARARALESITANTRSLDDLVRTGEIRVDRLTFIKMDAEGSEPLILRGMRHLLSKTTAVLWIEVNRGSLTAAGSSPDDIEEVLRESGLSLYWPVYYREGYLVPTLRLRPIRNLRTELATVVDDYSNIAAFRLGAVDRLAGILT
jgi:FkbM family methyltransferase